MIVAGVEPISRAMRAFGHPRSANSRTFLRRSSRAACAGLTVFAGFAAFAVFVLRPRRLAGPAARFSASRRNASSAEIVFGSYCLGS